MNPIDKIIAFWLAKTTAACFIEIFFGMLFNVWNCFITVYKYAVTPLDTNYFCGVSNYIDMSTSHELNNSGDELICDNSILLHDAKVQEPTNMSTRVINNSTLETTADVHKKSEIIDELDCTEIPEVSLYNLSDSIEENYEISHVVNLTYNHVVSKCEPQKSLESYNTQENVRGNIKNPFINTFISEKSEIAIFNNRNIRKSQIKANPKCVAYSSSEYLLVSSNYEKRYADLNDYEINNFRDLLLEPNECYSAEVSLDNKIVTESDERKPIKSKEWPDDRLDGLECVNKIIKHNFNVKGQCINSPAHKNGFPKRNTFILKSHNSEEHLEHFTKNRENMKDVFSQPGIRFPKKQKFQENDVVNIAQNPKDVNNLDDEKRLSEEMQCIKSELERRVCSKKSKRRCNKNCRALRKLRSVESYFKLCASCSDFLFQNDRIPESVNPESESSMVPNTEENNSVKGERHEDYSLPLSKFQAGSVSQKNNKFQEHLSPTGDKNYYECTEPGQSTGYAKNLLGLRSDEEICPTEKAFHKDNIKSNTLKKELLDYIQASPKHVCRIDKINRKVHFNTQVKTFTYEPTLSITENFSLDEEAMTENLFMSVINDKRDDFWIENDRRFISSCPFAHETLSNIVRYSCLCFIIIHIKTMIFIFFSRYFRRDANAFT